MSNRKDRQDRTRTAQRRRFLSAAPTRKEDGKAELSFQRICSVLDRRRFENGCKSLIDECGCKG